MKHLSAAQIEEFNEQGFLVVKDVLDPEEDIAPVIAEYGEVLDGLARELYERGDISSTFDHLPFGERLTRIYVESGKVQAQYFDFSLPQKGIKADTPFWTGPAVFKALRNEIARPGGVPGRPGNLLGAGAARAHQAARTSPGLAREPQCLTGGR
jgi:hypothetical protein